MLLVESGSVVDVVVEVDEPVVLVGGLVVEELGLELVDELVPVPAVEEVGEVVGKADDGGIVLLVVTAGRVDDVESALIKLSAGIPGLMGSLACGGRFLGAIRGPAGCSVVVVVVEPCWISSATSAVPPAGPVVFVSKALNASGAATAKAVTVDKDSARRNRLRPVVSFGRCRYIRNVMSGRGPGRPLSCFSIGIVRLAQGCGMNSPL